MPEPSELLAAIVAAALVFALIAVPLAILLVGLAALGLGFAARLSRPARAGVVVPEPRRSVRRAAYLKDDAG